MRAAKMSWIFVGLVIATNWSYVVTYDRKSGLTETAIHAVGLPILVALIGIPFLLRRIYRLIRDYLDRGIRIPKTARFVDWSPCLLLLPVLIHWSSHSVGTASDGVLFTRKISYGSSATVWVLGAAIILIGLYQIYIGLLYSGGDNDAPKA